jgi:hypothetical protein
MSMRADWPSPLPQRLRPDATGRQCCRFFVQLLSEMPLTPLPLSLYNLQSPPAVDIEIDIETVEKLIGEIIVQPLR